MALTLIAICECEIPGSVCLLSADHFLSVSRCDASDNRWIVGEAEKVQPQLPRLWSAEASKFNEKETRRCFKVSIMHGFCLPSLVVSAQVIIISYLIISCLIFNLIIIIIIIVLRSGQLDLPLNFNHNPFADNDDYLREVSACSYWLIVAHKIA